MPSKISTILPLGLLLFILIAGVAQASDAGEIATVVFAGALVGGAFRRKRLGRRDWQVFLNPPAFQNKVDLSSVGYFSVLNSKGFPKQSVGPFEFQAPWSV